MPVAVLSGAVQASEAQAEPIRHRSNRFRIATRRGYAAAEWLGSTWRFQVRLQQPLGISAIPATQPLSGQALNPRGRVPVIVDDGFALFESAAILEFLEDKQPGEPRLFSANLRE